MQKPRVRKRSKATAEEVPEDPTKAMSSDDLLDLVWGCLRVLTDRAIESPTVREGIDEVLMYFTAQKEQP